MEKEVKMLTIRQTAETGILSESALRALFKEEKLPGFYVGNRFLVNYNLLIKQLDEMSKSKQKMFPYHAYLKK